MEPITAHGFRGYVEFDGHTVTIHRTNSMGLDSTMRVAIGNITGVELHAAGWTRGHIAFNVPGAGSTSRLGMGGLVGSGMRNRSDYSLPFDAYQTEEMAALRDAVEHAIHTDRPDGGPAGMLRTLGDLHDAGVLTDAEFEAAKGRVLARL